MSSMPVKKNAWKRRYDKNYITSYCQENNCHLVQLYKGKCNRDAKIAGVCIVKGCSNIFIKSIRTLAEINDKHPNTNLSLRRLCEEHTVVRTCNGLEIIKRNITNNPKKSFNEKFIMEFIKKHNLKLAEPTNTIWNRETRLIGYCTFENCGDCFNKTVRNLDRDKNFYCMHHVKYLVGMASAERDKLGDNCKKRLEKYKNTCMERYGTLHPSQDPTVANRMSRASYKNKNYLLPSGNKLIIQGYENFALDILLKQGYKEDDIFTDRKNVPEIWYSYDKDKNYHRYYTDIYIKSENKCIEVKSIWSFKRDIKDPQKVSPIIKQKATKYAGYKCEIWIINEKGKILEIRK